MLYGMAGDADSLGKRIRRARERAHLTQEELAKRVGRSVRAVNDWENNRSKPKSSMGALEDVLETVLDADAGEQGPPALVTDNADFYQVVGIWNLPGHSRGERLAWIREWLMTHHPERLPGSGEASA